MNATVSSQPERDLTSEELAAIEEKYDEVAAARPLGSGTSRVINLVAIIFALYHFLTAGFGIPVDYWHMGWHLAGLFILIYCFYPIVRSRNLLDFKPSLLRPGNVPIYDIILIILGCASALYIGTAWRGIDFLGIQEQTFRQGNPNNFDIFFGAVLIILVLDIARRTLGWVLPAIILVFICYALFGPYIPVQILQHPGVNIRQFINNMYFPAEGIFGVTLWVVSTIVFHFVLFGVIAQKTGLGQLFIDNAMILAGRYTGGPAKVSVVSSAFFGTISGSSVANTVSTGSLTIPNMKRLGYPAHFAGAVEAASSAGGQITPPIMGAAAFIMAEFLELPYTTIVVAAIFPAMMHYMGVFAVVHFTAKRLGLHGLAKDALPQLKSVWAEGWANIIPLVGLLIVLFSGYTPYMSAFCGISLAIIVGAARLREPITWIYPALFSAFVIWKFFTGGFSLEMSAVLLAGAWLGILNRQAPMRVNDMSNAVALGAKYALAVGAAAAAVGIVVGVINTTGVGFRVGFMVSNSAAGIAESLAWLFTIGGYELFAQADLQLFISLVLIAVSCILMGAGIPTTALYIMLVSVAQPALAQLGVPPIASHMFVLYYGVISEITPPVCTSAYAAAAIANAPPFKTGVTAFTLGLGKVLAPMAFVYAPVLLIVSSTGFDLNEFIWAATTALSGILFLSAAVSGYFLALMSHFERALFALAGVILISPNMTANLIAMAILLPAMLMQISKRRKASRAASAS